MTRKPEVQGAADTVRSYLTDLLERFGRAGCSLTVEQLCAAGIYYETIERVAEEMGLERVAVLTDPAYPPGDYCWVRRVATTAELGALLAEAKKAGVTLWVNEGRELMANGIPNEDLRARLKASRSMIIRALSYPQRPCNFHWGSPAHPCVRCGEGYRDHVRAWVERHRREDNVIPFPQPEEGA